MTFDPPFAVHRTAVTILSLHHVSHCHRAVGEILFMLPLLLLLEAIKCEELEK